MVDVVSLQSRSNNETTNKQQQQQQLQSTQPLLQNRLFYPFQGIHDDPNNFYAGNEYNKYGDLTINKNKRKTSTTTINSTELKRHKPLPSPSIVKANYTFTSKPYDVMDNLMYYY